MRQGATCVHADMQMRISVLDVWRAQAATPTRTDARMGLPRWRRTESGHLAEFQGWHPETRPKQSESFCVIGPKIGDKRNCVG